MPHLQALVERHKSDAFVLIGVNTGDDAKAYRAGLEKYGVSWLSAFQGDSNSITDLYEVQGFPTYLVLDAEGQIRSRGSDATKVDALVAQLLKETKRSSSE